MRLALAAFASVLALGTAACGSSDPPAPAATSSGPTVYTGSATDSPCGPGASSCTCVKISQKDYDVSCNTSADCVPITRGEICGTAQDPAGNVCPAANTAVNKDSSVVYDQDRSAVESTSCVPTTPYPIACVQNRCVLEVPSGESAGGGGGDGVDDGTGVVVIDYGDDDDSTGLPGDDGTGASGGDDDDDTVVVVTGDDDDDDDQGTGSSGDDDDDDDSSEDGKRPHVLSRTVYRHHHHHTNGAPLAHSPPVTDTLE